MTGTPTCHWVMSHIWMSHVTHMHESCHTYELVMSHIWMSHVTHMNESCHTYEWVKSNIWMSHVTHMNESCHTYEWVIPYMHTIYIQVCRWHEGMQMSSTYKSLSSTSHVIYILIHMCDMTWQVMSSTYKSLSSTRAWIVMSNLNKSCHLHTQCIADLHCGLALRM